LNRRYSIRIGILLGVSGAALAEDPPPAPPAPAVKKESAKPPKKGKRREQKETEGTEAPGRFEADTILKSPYSINGQPLEVDPD
jgi:hypothetical protein